MKRIGLFCTSLLLATALLAQTTINDPNAQVRDVKGFHGIRVATGIELMLTQGKTEAVAVSAISPEHRDKIKTVVENGILRIYYDHPNVDWKFWKKGGDKKLKAYVSIITIDRLLGSSGATVNVDGALEADKLNVDMSSGSVFNGRIKAESLTVDQSSGSVMNVAGSVSRLKVDGSSGSVFHGFDLATERSDADTSSGAVVQVTVNKELNADASSGGRISYKGEGVIRNIRTSSGGNVSRKG